MVLLKKGEDFPLPKENNLSKVVIGLGWEPVGARPPKGTGIFLSFFSLVRNKIAKKLESNIDCDASVFMLKNGKLVNQGKNGDIICYWHLEHISGAVVHTGDNLTGEGDGDDEQIQIDLSRVPSSYDELVIAVNIFQARERKQDFGNINKAYIRIVDVETEKTLCHYELTEDYAGMTAMIFGELIHQSEGWIFKAIGEGTHDGSIEELAKKYF